MSEQAPRGRDIVVFDGVCHLCSGWVQFLLKRDKAQRYAFASMQGEAGQRLMREQGIDPDDPSSFLLVRDGRAQIDSGAVISVVTGLGGAWKLVGVMRAIPRGLRDPFYRFIARHRYRVLGKRSTCFLPTPEQAGRFHD